MQIKQLSCTDDMVQVWKISRPYVLEDNLSSEDLLKMNLPINQFKVLTLYIKSSILFRDLIFTFRPVSDWARSNRTIKFTKDNIKLSDDIDQLNLSDKVKELAQKSLSEVIDRVSKGEKQDYVKRNLPLMTETEFCINVNYRTLMNIIYTFELHCKEYFNIFINELDKLPGFSKSDYEISNKSDLFDDVSLTKDELDLDESVHKVGSTNILKVRITANLMAQFIRQHSSTIKNELWNDAWKIKILASNTCSRSVQCLAILSDKKLGNLTSVRTCWFAQFDKEDPSSWSYVLKNYVNKMTPKEFMTQLPCKGKCNNCKIYKDMQPRILHTEVNPPCPILIENPYLIEQRVSQYKSDSTIMEKWKELKPYIRFNPSNSDNKLYSSIQLEAGTNVR